jgi:hypothetical protein
MLDDLMRELTAYPGCDGLCLSDLLGLPDALRHIVTWITRRGSASLADLADKTGSDLSAAADLATVMIARGLLMIEGDVGSAPSYRARLVDRRSRGGGSDRLRGLFNE